MKNDFFLGLSEEGFHRIAYRIWGQATDLPSVICVHGLTRNKHDFDALGEYLAQQGRQVFCPDIVGRGDSDWLNKPEHYTYEQYMADMNVLIALTGRAQVDWIGTSMGGLIGMVLASLPKTPIRRLILNDIGPQVPTKGLIRLSQYAGKDPTFSSLDEAKAYFKSIYTDFGHLTEAQWQTLTENSVRATASGKWISKLDPGVKLGTSKSKLAWQSMMHPIKALEGVLFDIDLWYIWRKVTCPVLVLHGKKSDILLPDIIAKMQSIHPQTEVIEIADAGHAPALLDPLQLEQINQWLKNN